MRLKTIKLKNYCQHRDRTEEINGSLLAILGRNGAGKSNFIGAIQYVLTGDQPGKNKKDLVSWGEKDGYVDLSFDYNGMSCNIRRYITSPACVLTFGKEKISGAKAVESALKERFGIDKDLCKQIIFVRQAETSAILFDEPRKRELAFQRLAGLGDTEKICNVLGGIIQKYDVPDNYDTFLDDAERNLATVTERCNQLKQRSDDMTRELNSMPDKKSMMSLLSQLQTDIATEKGKLKDAEDLENFKAFLANATKMLETAKAEKHPEKSVEELVKEHEKLSSAVNKVSAYRKVLTQISFLEEELSNAMKVKYPTEEEIEAADQKARQAQDKAVETRTRISTLSSYISNVHDTGTCPLCGTELKFNLAEKLASQKGDAEKSLLALEKDAVNAAPDLRAKRANAVGTINSLDWKLGSAKSMKETYEKDYPSIASSDLLKGQKLLEEANNALILRRAWEDKITKAERDVAVYTESIKRLSGAENLDKSEISKRIEELSNQSATVSNGIQRYDQMTAEIAALSGAIITTDEQIKASHQYITDLKAKKEDTAETRKRLEVLKTARQALHYTEIPRELSLKIVRALTKDVNGYLQLFSAPFAVEPSDEGVGFLVRFTDGRKVPDQLPDASFLSGGQKVQLAVAFRFATYGLFASKLGLLVLDEPTAYLDEDAITRFGDVLKKIMDVAKAMNVQVLCATHHQQVSAEADQTICL